MELLQYKHHYLVLVTSLLFDLNNFLKIIEENQYIFP